MFKSRSIQSKLFFNYSLLILGVIIVFAISFYIYISKILENKAFQSLFQISSHISAEFDSQLKYMNSTSTKILFSKPLNNLFFSDIFHLNKSTITEQRQFNDILYSIIGFERDFPQINMFQTTGEFASFGDSSTFSVISPGQIAAAQWVQATLANKGTRLISLPHKDDWNSTQKVVISLNRAFSKNWNTKVTSILEIQQDYHVFTGIISSALVQPDTRISNDIKVYVFNKAGELVFPLEKDSMAGPYWESVNSATTNIPIYTVKHPDTKGENMLAFSYSNFSEWTVIVAESKNLLMKPVQTFRNVIIVLGFITLLITLLISYIVSKTLTTPIKKIYKSIKSLSLTTLSPKSNSAFTSGLNELEQLNISFHEMRWRLQESLTEAIASRSHEIEAHIFALQAQMNPHFLYNTLSNLSIMAEENGQKAIVDVCESLSVMLRYISSDHAAPVRLGQELEHTLNYLNLMKLRYEDNVSFQIDVSEKLLGIDVPKLMIQPIVENCMKYGINVDPPWIITIQGHYYPDRWKLIIRDNGQGFAEQQLKQLQAQLDETDPLAGRTNLKINGMGILNIYIRLSLLFGSRMSFELSNHAEGGAVVTIAVHY